MPTVLDRPGEFTLTDLTKRFGPMPASRIRMIPAPGTATVTDVLALHRRERRLYELIDGVLVEKVTGYEESILAAKIIALLEVFVERGKLGVVAGEGGMLRLAPDMVRIPDVSFIGRSRLPDGKPPRGPLPRLVPNLAVEVLSKGNTEREMARKLVDYFEAGVDVVWFVDPPTRSVRIFRSPEKFVVLKGSQVISGGTILPGFKVKVAEIFAKLDEC